MHDTSLFVEHKDLNILINELNLGSIILWRFKPFLSVGWRVHSFMVQKLLAVSVLRKKVK